MRLPRFRRSTQSNLQFLTLSTGGWFGLFLWACPHEDPASWQLLFAAGASIIAFVILKILGYFDPLRVVPRKSSAFLVLLAIPFSAYALDRVGRLIIDSQSCIVCSTPHVLLWSPILALLVFCAHYYLSAAMLTLGKKRKVVLDLLPEERAATIKDLNGLDMSEHTEYLSRADLKGVLLRAAAHEIDLIIISREAAAQFEAEAILIRAHLRGIPILDHRSVSTTVTGRISLEQSDMWAFLLGARPQTAASRAFSMAKRVIEPILAAVIAVLLSPVMLILSIMIRRTSKGPIFFRQIRTGYLGRNFTLVKFRSMYIDAEANGPQWSSDSDSRITPLGKFLRKTRLDELPQLWNVMRGEMSFFGPRPERPEMYRELKKEIPLFSMRTVVRPGITGWAQVCAGYAASVEESKTKLEYDLFYIQHMSLRLDLIILIKTALVAALGEQRPEIPAEQEAAPPLAAENS